MKTRAAAIAALLCLLTSAAVAAPQPTPTPVTGPARVVIDLTTGDLATFESRILGLLPKLRAHYQGQQRTLEAVAVVHGDAYRFFLKDLAGTPYAEDAAVKEAAPRLRAALEKLTDAGVRFELCLGGMKKRDLDPKNAYPFTHIVPNAFIALIDWQNRGYAWLPID